MSSLLDLGMILGCVRSSFVDERAYRAAISPARPSELSRLGTSRRVWTRPPVNKMCVAHRIDRGCLSCATGQRESDADLRAQRWAAGDHAGAERCQRGLWEVWVWSLRRDFGQKTSFQTWLVVARRRKWTSPESGSMDSGPTSTFCATVLHFCITKAREPRELCAALSRAS